MGNFLGKKRRQFVKRMEGGPLAPFSLPFLKWEEEKEEEEEEEVVVVVEEEKWMMT